MQISEQAKDILQEVVSTGIGRAAVSFSEILGREINLTFPKLLIIRYKELIELLKQKKTADYVNIRQGFTGGLNGMGIVSFSLNDGKTLVSKLIESQNNDDPEFGILERETIMEIGNVLINAIVCTISDMVSVETQYQLPKFDTSLDRISIPEDSSGLIYCFAEGSFSVEGMEIQGIILFILAYDKIEHIITKLNHL